MSDMTTRDEPTGRTREQWLEQVQKLEKDGEYFRAYDTALQGLVKFPDDLRLKHRAVLALARSGATAEAQRKYDEFRMGGSDEVDIASLGARLLKDSALGSHGADRTERLAEAAERYERIFRRTGDYYPGINAATLRLLAGDAPAAQGIAREVIGLVDLEATAPEDRYFALASLLEAHVILGELDSAEALAHQAYEAGKGDPSSLATTVRQIRLLLEHRGLDQAWLATLSPHCVIHYVGHIFGSGTASGGVDARGEAQLADAIRRELDRASVGSGYGSLAAGSDILFAEALIARGASLHVTLPFNRREFVEISVAPAGAAWVERFERCCAKAAGLSFATEDRYLGDDRLFGYCSELSMGLAVLAANHLETTPRQIAMWNGVENAGPSGTAADVARWRSTGLPQTIIPFPFARASRRADRADAPATPRVVCAMLFGDVHGFSKLGDAELPTFIERVLGELGAVIGSAWKELRYVNTWGDGLYLVFEDAAAAARCALALQTAMAGLDLAALGLPGHLALRIGGHFGPAYAGADPILKRNAYFGAHVSRAARIEPVTPGGCVYVTEPFAAALALRHGDEFACDYVGETESAKNFGKMPMFHLRRR